MVFVESIGVPSLRALVARESGIPQTQGSRGSWFRETRLTTAVNHMNGVQESLFLLTHSMELTEIVDISSHFYTIFDLLRQINRALTNFHYIKCCIHTPSMFPFEESGGSKMTLHKTDVLLVGCGIMSKTLAMLVTHIKRVRLD